METLIDDYVERRRVLFPNIRLRPRHHYLTHYGFLTMQFGPLIRLWTMRLESKHQYFERCVKNAKNFIDVTGMLPNRHQVLQAHLSVRPRFQSNHFIGDTAASMNLSSTEFQKLLDLDPTVEASAEIYSEITVSLT